MNVVLILFLCAGQANRALRQATLGTLNSLVVAYGDKIGSSTYETIIVELSSLIRYFLVLNSLCPFVLYHCGNYCLIQWNIYMNSALFQ